MRKAIAITGATLTTLGLVVGGAAIASADNTSLGNPGAGYVGNFHKNLDGYSLFVQDASNPTDYDDAGDNVQVFGTYRHLDESRPFFTVIYGNRNCDPAQAFPVGSFQTDSKGEATLKAAVPANGLNVAGSGSISVRYGDVDRKTGKPTDQDNDGITGAGDVVAVAGQPKIGLRECDTRIDALP